MKQEHYEMSDYDQMADQLASRMSALLAAQPFDVRSRSMDDVADLLAQAGLASHLDRSSPPAFTRSLFQRGRSVGRELVYLALRRDANPTDLGSSPADLVITLLGLSEIGSTPPRERHSQGAVDEGLRRGGRGQPSTVGREAERCRLFSGRKIGLPR
jgi:hypothetical protein